MSLYCLVHGSTQNASGWDLLAIEMEKRGHQTVRTSLPSDEPDASATTYARVIADSIPPGADGAIVVAHSASGVFLPLTPQFRKIGHMVFLAAMIPEPGKSVFERLRADPSMLNPEWIGKDPTRDDDAAKKFLFHDCSPEVAAWAMTTRSLTLARQAMIEPCPLESWPDVPASYIICAEDRTIQPEWSRREARRIIGIEPLELPGGHCPHVSRPAVLANLLDCVTI